jgi:hypothetical protein
MGYFSETIDGAMLTAVNEAYFGKTKEVLRIEAAIHDLRKMIGTKYHPLANINTYVGSMRIKGSKEEKALKKAIGDAFGFSDVVLEWTDTMIPNIGTYATSICIDLGYGKLNRSMKSTSSKTKGFKFDKNDHILFDVVLCTGVFESKEFTDAEITAILLHEIGHNFTPAVNNSPLYLCPALTWACMVLGNILENALKAADGQNVNINPTMMAYQYLYTMIMYSNAGKKGDALLDDMITEIISGLPKPCKLVIGAGGGILALLREAFYSLMRVVGTAHKLMWMQPARLIYTVTSGIVGKISRPDGYTNERFADTFAQMYGYGPELISGLNKLTSNYDYTAADTILNRVPILPTLFEFYTMPYTLLQQAMDEHPTNPARAKIVISNLENELKKEDLSPASRKCIEEDIKRAYQMCDDFYDYKPKYLMRAGGGTRVYEKFLFKVFGGDLRHLFIGTKTMDKIDKQLNDL